MGSGLFRMNTDKKIILSRALTNSGDQAWDFAVPVSLAILLPGKLNLVALVFFISRLSHVLLLPLVGQFMDRISRMQTLQVGLSAQFLGVLIQAVSIVNFSTHNELILVGVIVGGILTGLGSAMTNIGVAQDLVPSLFSGPQLTQVNSRVRQVDLFSEVCSPIVAGLLLLISYPQFPQAGLCVVAIWNLVSFFPEYILIKEVLVSQRDMLRKPPTSSTRTPIWKKLSGGWRDLLKLSIAPAVFAYALLWLSALSPHGVLLTSYLKESWKLPELTLGIFRGLGAIFGLIATLIFPILVSRFGLLRACRHSIVFQSFMLIVALVAFHLRAEWMFLGFILFSRIGLYAFSLGEQQIRQTGIPESLRGSVNATASALTGIGTLCLLGLGSILGSVEKFDRLVDISVLCVAMAGVLYSFGMKRHVEFDLKNNS